MTDLIFIFWLYYNINIVLLSIEYFCSLKSHKSTFTRFSILLLLCNLLGMPGFNLFFIKFHLFLIYFSQYSYFGGLILFWLNIQLYFLYLNWYKLWINKQLNKFTCLVISFTRVEIIFVWSFFHSGVNWYFLIYAFSKIILCCVCWLLFFCATCRTVCIF